MPKSKRHIGFNGEFIKVIGTVDTDSGILIHTENGDETVFDILNHFNGKKIKMYILEENSEEITIQPNTHIGNFKLTATDITRSILLPNAKIAVYKKGGGLVQEQQTNIDGTVLFKGLEVGDYYFKEIQAPEGYIPDNIIHEFSIDRANETVEVVLMNQPILGDVQLTVLGIEGQPLQGAEFALYTSSDIEYKNPIAVSQSNSEGILFFKELKYGEYIIKQTKVSTGYIISEDIIAVKIQDHRKTIEYTIMNEIITGSISIKKIDEEDNTLLSNATFEIKDDKQNVIDTLTTDSNGTVMLENIPYGNYTLKETQAPEGYVLNEDLKTFIIDTEGKEIEFIIPNIRKPVYKIVLNEVPENGLQINETYQLDVSVQKDGIIVDNPILTFNSSDKTVAEVDSDGLITALGVGETTITITCEDEQENITIKVINNLE